MAAYITPGRSKVWWVNTITTPSGPGAVEINAGVELSAKLQGIPAIPRTANMADSSDLSSTFEKRQRGTVGGDALTFNLKRDTSTETEYGAMVEGEEGYLVVARKGVANGSTAAFADKVDVFTCIVNKVGDGNPGRNDVDFAEFELAITANPNRDVSCITT
jgi:hypothetical protein